MRTLLALCCAVALGGCAIVINPNDGEVRHADSGGNAIQGNEQVSRDVRQVSTITALDIDSMKRIGKESSLNFADDEAKTLDRYKSSLDKATRFIPTWVKVAVAFALGLGTMIGWKRIVVTVGEKIGKSHLTYAQGASAELVAMATIGAADAFGMPVSTTHVLSSGVAGTMTANKSGLQMSTVRNLLMAWVLTLPVSITLAGSLYWVFSKIF